MPNFCNLQNERFKNAAFDAIREIITIEDEVLAGIYDFFYTRHDASGNIPIVNDYITITRQHLRDPFNIDNQYIYSGIDFPSWLIVDNPIGTIMIVGQDPHRGQKYFQNNLNPNANIVIGTPYSFHSNELKANPYWNIAEGLSNAQYNLYFTDANKVWAADIHNIENRYNWPQHCIKKFKRIIVNEYCDLHPDFVVTYGNAALNMINEKLLNNTIGDDFTLTENQVQVHKSSNKVIPVTHPSPGNAHRAAFLNCQTDLINMNQINPNLIDNNNIAEAFVKIIIRAIYVE